MKNLAKMKNLEINLISKFEYKCSSISMTCISIPFKKIKLIDHLVFKIKKK